MTPTLQAKAEALLLELYWHLGDQRSPAQLEKIMAFAAEVRREAIAEVCDTAEFWAEKYCDGRGNEVWKAMKWIIDAKIRALASSEPGGHKP